MRTPWKGLSLFSRNLPFSFPPVRQHMQTLSSPHPSSSTRRYCTSYAFPDHHRHPPSPASSSPEEELRDIIVSGVGNLDDMEASLDQLKGLVVTPALVARVVDSFKTLAPLPNSNPYLNHPNNDNNTRRLLRFFTWSCWRIRSADGLQDLADETFNYVIRAFAEKKDFTAMRIVISDLERESREMDLETFARVVEALVNVGREDEAVRLFRDLEKKRQQPPEAGFLPQESQRSGRVIAVIHALCAKGHARKAEGVIWHHKEKLGSPMEPYIYKSVLHGWCIRGNAREARRVLGEMKSLGISPGLASYNAFLSCICKRNLKFNPSALVQEATDIMTQMRSSGVLPTTVSFNILLSCLGRTRRVKEAYRVLYSMMQGNAGCSPDWISYYLVIRVLYLTGRFVRGSLIVDQITSAGLMPPTKFFHDLMGVLCGVENVKYALEMFERMKRCCSQDYGPTYDLLITKLCKNGEFDIGRCLWDEAVESGVFLQCSRDLLEPSNTEVFKMTRKLEKFIPKSSARVVRKDQKGFLRTKAKAGKKRTHAS